MDGVLQDDEITPELRAAATGELEARQRRARTRQTQATRVGRVANVKDNLANHLSDKKCFVEKEVLTARLITQLAARRCTVTEDRAAADIFVAADPTKLGQRSRLCSVLRGAFVVTARAFDDTFQGPITKCRPATSVRRTMYMTAGFEAKHAEVAGIFRTLLHTWKFLSTLEDLR